MTEPGQDLREQRLRKVGDLRALGRNPYGNGYVPSHTAAQIHAQWGGLSKEALAANPPTVTVAGRVVMARHFGKAGFFKLQDRSGQIQLYCQKQHLPEADFAVFQLTDLGDIVQATGPLFYTKTGELTVQADAFTIVTKALRPLPEKWHGLTDVETRYRHRSLDLITNPDVRTAFVRRARIIESLRRFFTAHEFLEVETPMMHPIPGGANARPFATHHNALDMALFLRVAPELYLKRLVVGGFERVFEINRNFRNEGVSTQHNPEFTMIEWYQAFATFEDGMRLIEHCLESICREVIGGASVTYQSTPVDFAGPYRRLRLVDALHEIGGVPSEILQDATALTQFARDHRVPLKGSGAALGVVQTLLFEHFVEAKLINPTFITHYPVEVSPLARRNEAEPQLTDRFELIICGREIANGFSELNDPIDQAERFRAQVAAKGRGDLEAMHFDADYIYALEHGMPPTAGAGLGVDRLVMLLTDAASIRDVILFPLLRTEERPAT